MERQIRRMGGKLTKSSTPPHTWKIKGAWKKPNSSASPIKALPGSDSKQPYKPWSQVAQEGGVTDSVNPGCWAEALDAPTGSKSSKSTMKRTETSKRTRGGDGTILSPPQRLLTLEDTPVNKATFPRKLTGNSHRVMVIQKIGQADVGVQSTTSSSSSDDGSGNSSSTKKIDNGKETTFLLEDPKEFPPLSVSDTTQVKHALPSTTNPSLSGNPKVGLNDVNINSRPATKISKVSSGVEHDQSQQPMTKEQTPTVEVTSREVNEEPMEISHIDGSKQEESVVATESGILHCIPQSGSVRYNPFYHRKTPAHAPQKPKEDLDKPIVLKQGQKRIHVHRYDMRISVKKGKNEDKEFNALKAALLKFLDLLLQADATIIIPPFYEIERSDKAASDFSSKFQVSDLDSQVAIKRYFARLSKVTDRGFAYCNVIIAHSSSFLETSYTLRSVCVSDT
jgi:hypothetical protein